MKHILSVMKAMSVFHIGTRTALHWNRVVQSLCFVSIETLLGNIQGLLKVTNDNVRMVERQMLVDRGMTLQLLFQCWTLYFMQHQIELICYIL